LKILKHSLLFIFLFFSTFGYGQLRTGVATGANFNSFTQPGTTIGINGGIFLRYHPISFLEAQLEILYSLKGGGRHDFVRLFDQDAGTQGNLTSVTYLNRSVLLHTLEIPLSLRLSLPDLEEASIKPNLLLGFSYAYVFGAFEQKDGLFTFSDGIQVLLSNLEENITSDVQSYNLGYLAGIGIDFSLENGRVFTLEFRYHRGINNLNKINFGDPQVTENLYSQTISIGIAYELYSF
jgi:hypothetical protein